MEGFDIFDCISPIDYRYWEKDVAKYLSENGFTTYKLLVEEALIKALCDRKICTEDAVAQIQAAAKQVTTQEVYEEEKRIEHDIRALVNCLRDKVSDDVKPFIHMTATSFDISDTANAARYKDAIQKVIVPDLIMLEQMLVNITIREAHTVQIGRTHGQHAVPITFGFALAEYVSRLGECIEMIKMLAPRLVGKFSGAVGAYNASSLFFENPKEFEKEVLGHLGMRPGEHSTQIVHPEALTRVMCEMTITASVLANLSDDMRNLQRTEIGEIGEEFGADQVGSSTMPQKKNPINFENAKSCWKIIMPRIITVFMDQISEHQRDLTNSASARTYPETLCYVSSMAKRLARTLKKLVVDKDNLARCVAMQKDLVLAEPLYIILASLGHPNAHEMVKKLTQRAQREKETLLSLMHKDSELSPYIKRMTARQITIFDDPKNYIGIAPQEALRIAHNWKEKLNI